MTDKLSAQLMEAVDRLDELSRSEIQVLLRRAALRLDSRTTQAEASVIDPSTMVVLDEFATATGVSRDEAIDIALRDWAIGMGLLNSDELL